MRRRAMAIAMFSLPWKYLLAVSDDIVIRTFGSQSTSSDHSQCRLPSSPDSAARMLTTRSRSVNSKRWGTSASRSFGPMPGSASIIEKTSSMTSTNSSSEENSASATGGSARLATGRRGLGGRRLGRRGLGRRLGGGSARRARLGRCAGGPRRRRAARARFARRGGARRAAGLGRGRGGRALELGDAARERLHLGPQAADVLEHAQVVEALADPLRGGGDLVEQGAPAVARALRAPRRRLEG